MNNTTTSTAIRHRVLTLGERTQLESVLARTKRINAEQAEEGDRYSSRLFADVEFLLSLIDTYEAVERFTN
jgi:hypothetical protein